MGTVTRSLFLAAIAVLSMQMSESKPQADLDTLIGEVFGGGNNNNNNNNDNNDNNDNNNNNNNQPESPPPPPPPPSTDIREFQPSGGNPLECQCVPYYLCMNNTIITDGVGLIDIRSGFLPTKQPCNCPASNTPGIKDGPCENYLDVCCQKPNQVERPITPKPNIREGCGRRNPEGVGFRIKGDENNEAQFGEFPWMVAILREETVDKSPEKLNVYQCGGALIHSQVVLTAAHCVAALQGPYVLKIRAGEWDTQTKNELLPHQDRQVKNVVVHPGYSAGTLKNDIALLFLESPVEYAENVDIVCLPEQGALFDFSRCFASGWGKDTFGKEGRYQVILKKVELPIVPRDRCLEALRKTRLGPYFQLDNSFICAGGENGKDTCKGDGGSPLVCPLANDRNRYQQAGIVAWGIGCGENNTPGVYANVALFRDWIDEIIAYEGLNPTQNH